MAKKRPTMEEALSQYKVIKKYMVHWGDMDAAKHVNNLNYLKWAESGRIHYFQQMGMDISFTAANVGPILGWQDCKYIFPMSYPDTAIVGVRIAEILEDRLLMECAIFSEKHQRIAALSKQSIIPYSYKDFRKAAIPDGWIKGIKQIEGEIT